MRYIWCMPPPPWMHLGCCCCLRQCNLLSFTFIVPTRVACSPASSLSSTGTSHFVFGAFTCPEAVHIYCAHHPSTPPFILAAPPVWIPGCQRRPRAPPGCRWRGHSTTVHIRLPPSPRASRAACSYLTPIRAHTCSSSSTRCEHNVWNRVKVPDLASLGAVKNPGSPPTRLPATPWGALL